MPVWRNPTSGMQLSTVSPSSSMSRRSTPWVEGCCGPMFRIMVPESVRVSESMTMLSALLTTAHGTVELDRLFSEREVFAQRVSFPVVGHQDAAQVGVAVEADAEHVVDLALGPVRGGPDVRDRWQ